MLHLAHRTRARNPWCWRLSSSFFTSHTVRTTSIISHRLREWVCVSHETWLAFQWCSALLIARVLNSSRLKLLGHPTVGRLLSNSILRGIVPITILGRERICLVWRNYVYASVSPCILLFTSLIVKWACICCHWIPLLGIKSLIVLASCLLLLYTIINTSTRPSGRFSLDSNAERLCNFLVSRMTLTIILLESRLKILFSRIEGHLWLLLLIFLHLHLPGVILRPTSMTYDLIFDLLLTLSYLLSLDVFLDW